MFKALVGATLGQSDCLKFSQNMLKNVKKQDADPNNFLRSLQYSKPFESKQTKYEKSMEPYAIRKFIREDKTLHKKFNVSDSRMVLMEEDLFTGASPLKCSLFLLWKWTFGGGVLNFQIYLFFQR